MKQNGVILTWQNFNATVKDKQILHNITGMATPGLTYAIMGASGAGKTTLLSALAKRTDSKVKVSGTVLSNGQEYTSTSFYGFGSFVFQNDILNEPLTVRETLEFTASLKIKDRQEAQGQVEEMINKFMLEKCEHTIVGGKLIKGISGGEKKRLCIALEVISKPELLILDEPTSGLDSYMANSVLKILNRLAGEDGKTVIFTIHQPSFKIYCRLNQLILLDKGTCIYQGEARGITEYMMGLQIQIPAKSTICDFFMFEVSEYKARTKQYETPLTEQSYNRSLREAIDAQIDHVLTCQDLPRIQPKDVQQDFLTQLRILFGREIKLLFKNFLKLGRQVASAILMTAIIGLIFLRVISVDRPNTEAVYLPFDLFHYFGNAQSVTFICITAIIMTGLNSVMLVFPTEREVFSKEASSKTYDTLPYFLSKLFFELLNIWMVCILFSAAIYSIVGYQLALAPFFKFILAQCVVGMVGSSIGLLSGSFFKDVRKASSMGPAFLLPLMIFNGLYNQISAIPAWIRWMQYISPFRYGLHALLVNEFEDQKFKMSDGRLFDYREQYSINLGYNENIIILLGLSVLYYGLSYLTLRMLSTKLAA